jgi:exopolysaccharide biosynthesis operon protein EpsL
VFRINRIFIAAKIRVGILAFLSIITPAFADQFDTVNYIGSVGVNFDNNVFRLPDGVDPQIVLGKPGKSDFTNFVSFGVNIDKKYSNQGLVFNLTGTKLQYRNFSNLDHTSSSYKGAWNWQISSIFKGGLSFTRAQTLNNPADTRLYTRNLNTIDNASLNGNWMVDSRLFMTFGVSNGKTTNTTNSINNLGSHSSANEWGFKYETVQGKSIQLISRYLKSINSNQIPNPISLFDTGSNEKQLETKVIWNITGKSVLAANLIDTDHQNFNFTQRDFRGTQGGVNYTLSVSGKTTMNIALQRTLNTWWDDASSYYVADSISISPQWQIDSKSVTYVKINYSNNDYRGAVKSGMPVRHDVSQSVLLGIDYSPQRALTISASLQHSSRSTAPATYAGYNFSDNTASLSVQANF